MSKGTTLEDVKIAVIGLGYVGLPLAVAFGAKYPTVGYDINRQRIEELKSGKDSTRECTAEELYAADKLIFTNAEDELAKCNFYIVTVPTPINRYKSPDLTALIAASELVGSVVKPGDIVVYESTVYPGATEEECVPIIESRSGLTFNKDFYVGYSPERINPGDKNHRLTNIKKVTSGSTPEAAAFIDKLYGSVIQAGTHLVSSVRVAESAKVIENTQRDLNIALINEFSIIFNKLGIDTQEVLEAAETKWNFLSFRPGLVGGHCISVDPYYLTHKAQSIGYHPEVILAGRRINDNMGKHVAKELIHALIKKRIHVEGADILIMGLTFKENCPDTRNSRVFDIIDELKQYNVNIDIYEPWLSNDFIAKKYGLNAISNIEGKRYDAVVLAVAHDEFKRITAHDFGKMTKSDSVVYDLKYVLPPDVSDIRL